MARSPEEWYRWYGSGEGVIPSGEPAVLLRLALEPTDAERWSDDRLDLLRWAARSLRRMGRSVDDRESVAGFSDWLERAGFPPTGADRPGWVRTFYFRMLSASYPPGFWEDDPDALLDFLEGDPIFFRSGYAKTGALRALSRMELTGRRRARAAGVFRRVVLAGWSRQMKEFARLSRFLSVEELEGLLREAEWSDDRGVRDRAARVRRYFRSRRGEERG